MGASMFQRGMNMHQFRECAHVWIRVSLSVRSSDVAATFSSASRRGPDVGATFSSIAAGASRNVILEAVAM